MQQSVQLVGFHLMWTDNKDIAKCFSRGVIYLGKNNHL